MAKKTTLYALGTVLGFGVTLFLCGGVLAVQTMRPNASSSQLLLSTDSTDHLVIPVTLKVQAPNGKAQVTWNKVVEPGVKKRDSTIAGYKIYMGTASRTYVSVVDTGSKTSYTLTQLPVGTYYFSVTSYDKNGQESPYSDEVSKTIN